MNSKKQSGIKREKTHLQTRLQQNLSLPSRFQLPGQRHFKLHRSFRISFRGEPQNSSGKHDSNPSQGGYALIVRYPVQCLVHFFLLSCDFSSTFDKDCSGGARRSRVGVPQKEKPASVRQIGLFLEPISTRHEQYNMQNIEEVGM
jgi:hypothetical protein